MNELAIKNYDDLMTCAKTVAGSGFFKSVTHISQAAVKIQAGAELGIPPCASVTNIHFFEDKLTLGATLVAGLVRKHPNYDYRVKESTDTSCVISFLVKNGGKYEVLGESSFTEADAQKAGLMGKHNWKKYPSDMLFARAITRGARRHTPDVFGGSAVYTKEELESAPIDRESYSSKKSVVNSDVIDLKAEEVVEEVKEPVVDNKEIIKKHREAVMHLMNDEGLVSEDDIKNCADYLKSVGIDLKSGLVDIFKDDVSQSSMIKYIKEYADSLKELRNEFNETDEDVDM